MKKIKFNPIDKVVDFAFEITHTSIHAKQPQKYVEIARRKNEEDYEVVVMAALVVVKNDFKSVKRCKKVDMHDSFEVQPKLLFYDRKGNVYYKTKKGRVLLTMKSMQLFEKRKNKFKKKVQHAFLSNE